MMLPPLRSRRVRPAIWVSCALACALLPVGPEAQARSSRAQGKAVESGPAKPEKPFPFNATWVLQTLNGKPVGGGEPPSFTLDDKLRATGFSGCNTFSMALYPIRGQKLAAGGIALTRKTCDKATMLAERNFLVGLHSMPRWDVSPNGDLSIKGASGLMQFRHGI